MCGLKVETYQKNSQWRILFLSSIWVWTHVYLEQFQKGSGCYILNLTWEQYQCSISAPTLTLDETGMLKLERFCYICIIPNWGLHMTQSSATKQLIIITS